MNSFPGHPDYDVQDVAAATFHATAQRCVDTEVVIVPVDRTSLNPKDSPWDRAAGVVGAPDLGVRGIQVVSAIAVHPDGGPLGLLGQAWWVRAEGPAQKQARDRDPEEKETWYWHTLLESTRELCYAYCFRPWFQLDQAGDAWLLLLAMRYDDVYMTVRSAHYRRVVADHIGDEPMSLGPILTREPPLGSFSLELPGQGGQEARRATVEMRTRPVTMKAKNKKTKRIHLIDVFAVDVREVDPAPEGVEPLGWILLTNRPTTSFEDACAVVLAYTYRWTTEELQTTWREGCGLDPATTLDFEGDSRSLAILMTTIAARAQRLLWIASEDPERPAIQELSDDELKAIVATVQVIGGRRERHSVAQVVRWLAQLGGWPAGAAGELPDARALSRGLELLNPLDRAVEELFER